MAGRVKDRQWWMLGIGLILCFETGIGLATSPPAHQSYRLGVNDLVHIQVYGEEDLNIESKIDGDGSIHFPLLGPLHVAGKTIQELQDDLTARLARGYVMGSERPGPCSVRSTRRNGRKILVTDRSLLCGGSVRPPGTMAASQL